MLARLFTQPKGTSVALGKATCNYLLVCLAVLAVMWASLAVAGITLNFDFVAQYRQRIASGFVHTLELSVAS